MGTSGTPQIRTAQKELSEDEALTLMFKEAETQLSAKRAARAKARQAYLRKAERERVEFDEKLHKQQLSKEECEDLAEKYQHVMESLSLMEREKVALLYEVEKLKDSLEDAEEELAEAMRKHEDKCKELESERITNCMLESKLKLVQQQLTEAEQTLKERTVSEVTQRATWMENPEEQTLATLEEKTGKDMYGVHGLSAKGLPERETDGGKLRDNGNQEIRLQGKEDSGMRAQAQSKEGLSSDREQLGKEVVAGSGKPEAGFLGTEGLELQGQGGGVQHHKRSAPGGEREAAQNIREAEITEEHVAENRLGYGEKFPAESERSNGEREQIKTERSFSEDEEKGTERGHEVESSRVPENMSNGGDMVKSDRKEREEPRLETFSEEKGVGTGSYLKSYSQGGNISERHNQQRQDGENKSGIMKGRGQEMCEEADTEGAPVRREGMMECYREQDEAKERETKAEAENQTEDGEEAEETVGAEPLSAESRESEKRENIFDYLVGSWLTGGAVKESARMGSGLVDEGKILSKTNIPISTIIEDVVANLGWEGATLQGQRGSPLQHEDQTGITQEKICDDNLGRAERDRTMQGVLEVCSSWTGVNTDVAMKKQNHGSDAVGTASDLTGWKAAVTGDQNIEQNGFTNIMESSVQNVLPGGYIQREDSSVATSNDDSYGARDGGTIDKIEKLILKVSMRRKSQEYEEGRQAEKESTQEVDGSGSESGSGILRFDPRVTIEEMFAEASMETEAAMEENSDDDVMHDCLESIEEEKVKVDQTVVDGVNRGDRGTHWGLEQAGNHWLTYSRGSISFEGDTAGQEEASVQSEEHVPGDMAAHKEISVESDESLHRNSSTTNIRGPRETLKRRKSSKKFTNSGDTCKIA